MKRRQPGEGRGRRDGWVGGASGGSSMCRQEKVQYGACTREGEEGSSAHQAKECGLGYREGNGESLKHFNQRKDSKYPFALENITQLPCQQWVGPAQN